jgi:formamidopyrimidine-DNA glycosylase
VPELPDITIYVEALKRRVLGESLKQVRIASPFLLRTFTPPIESIRGRHVNAVERLGKRIVIGFEDDLWLVVHLMIAGRLHWRPGTPPNLATSRKRAAGFKLAAQQVVFDFGSGTLVLTEAGTRRRASLHLVQGKAALRALNPGGLEVLECSFEEFARVLGSENHTLKRALTDPHLFSGIGNAYSDEILHGARLSPAALTQKLSHEEVARLHQAIRETIRMWLERLRTEAGDEFPENVTAFRPEMAVHGKFGKLCPVCGTKVQRIRYAENETNYCPRCQTCGKLLADRSLSLLLKKDWPKTVEELEELRAGARIN